MKMKIAVLFKDLCCSKCKSDFNEDSIEIMREEDEMLVFKLVCRQCGKSFGVAFLGIGGFELKNYSEDEKALKITGEPEPISEDEVLDAHKFIKEFDTNWRKFISNLKE